MVLANARLSAQSAKGYRRVRRLVAPALESLSAVAAQTEPDAGRLIELGAIQGRVHITGSLKFDISLPPSTQEAGAALRHQWGSERSVWIASSTHDGEEDVVLDAFAKVQKQLPNALLVLVPRHPERFARVATLCTRRKFSGGSSRISRMAASTVSHTCLPTWCRARDRLQNRCGSLGSPRENRSSHLRTQLSLRPTS